MTKYEQILEAAESGNGNAPASLLKRIADWFRRKARESAERNSDTGWASDSFDDWD